MKELDYAPLVARALALYAIPHSSIAPPQKGYRNSSYKVTSPTGTYNFILYKNEPEMQARIRRTNAIGDFLHTSGLPARHTADPRILQIKSDTQTRFGALYFYLPGQTIPWEAYTMDHLKMLGKTMSDMHAKLASFPGKVPDVAEELLALNKRITAYFANANITRAVSQKLHLQVLQTDFTQVIEACQELPAQTLHMDFVRGNILFDDTADITGILDFEKAGRGPRVFDIARTLAFLLVDCKYKRAEKIVKYFLHSGYNKRGSVHFNDWHMLQQLIPFFLLHDFYKFLRHNPYEYLPQNQHYVRTAAMLVKLGVLGVK